VARPWSIQYKSIIFYHNDEQKRLAVQTKTAEEARVGSRVRTEIVPFSRFYPAEDYHQKYRLQQVPELIREFRRIYPSPKDLVDSTAAARVNGYLGGKGNCETLRKELPDLGLSSSASEQLWELACARNGKKMPSKLEV